MIFRPRSLIAVLTPLLAPFLATFLAPLLTTAVAVSAQEIAWESRYYDPAEGADLILPLPCGGAMAFQRVVTPVTPDDPLADRPVRLGAGQPETGYVDYLRQDFLRGSFTDPTSGEAWFYLGRYEMTRQQRDSLLGECAPPDVRGTLPATGVSWFEAVDLSRRYSEWLRREAPGLLPDEDGAAAFVRLPTETEWEYAVRGGAAVSPTEFQARLHPMEGALRDHAWHQGADSARGQFRPIGRLAPNPLGLYDMFGNAEEMMFEPFRINNLGRPGGQIGGLVTRGGSIYSDEGAIYSAQRQEWPFFDVLTGEPQAQESFGIRFVLATHVTVTPERTNNIRNTWLTRIAADPEAVEDPLGELAALIDQETEPERRAALEAVRAEVAAANRRRNEARVETLKATFFGGAVLIAVLTDDEDHLKRLDVVLEDARHNEAQARALGDEELLEGAMESIAIIEGSMTRRRQSRDLSALSFERLLVAAASADNTPTLRRQARDVLDLEMESAGLANMRPLMRRFANATDAYSAAPETDLGDIIDSVIVQ